MLAATEDGHWVSYVFVNPDTGEEQRKHAWVVPHDGLIFGSGWYEPVEPSVSPDTGISCTRVCGFL